MNPKLPKPVFDALTKATGGSTHPSADVLTAFSEQSLPAREAEAVTAHLAQCAECREVVFLAIETVEDEQLVFNPELEQEWRHRVQPAMAAAPVQMTQMSAQLSKERKVPRKWRRLTWITPLAAALVIAAAFIVHDRSHVAEVRENIAYQIANNRAGAEEYAREAGNLNLVPAPQAGAKAQAIAPGATALSAEQRNALAAEKKRKLDEYRKQATATQAGDESLTLSYREPGAPGAQLMQAQSAPPPGANAVPTVTVAPNAVAAPPPTAAQNANLSAAPPPNAQSAGSMGGPHGFAGSMMNRKAAAKSENSVTVAANPNAQASLESAQLTPPEIDWRISRDGHLEVSIVAGSWRRELADQPTTFHAISVVSRKDIWAGGDGAALFHSTDGGQHFKRVAVPGMPEKATVIQIEFDDAQHGVIGTDDGKRWRTSDGGANWTKL